MVTMSPLVATTTADVVAAVSAVMTVLTKTQKQSIQKFIKCQLENIQQSIKLKIKTRELNNQHTIPFLINSKHATTNGVTAW
jgi:hypothetical protein